MALTLLRTRLKLRLMKAKKLNSALKSTRSLPVLKEFEKYVGVIKF